MTYFYLHILSELRMRNLHTLRMFDPAAPAGSWQCFSYSVAVVYKTRHVLGVVGRPALPPGLHSQDAIQLILSVQLNFNLFLVGLSR